jgi:L-ascorbate metabolism protein UlaG (beta-lactamase superfamily)
MEITWLGHSCFRLKGKQATVVTDPFSPDLGYPPLKLNARIVTVSHQHPGHSCVEGVAGNPHQVTGPGEYEISNVLIIGVATKHDKDNGRQRGKNTAYLIEIDDIAVCHLGDLGHTLSDEQIEELGKVDVLMVPVGGVSTINAATAAEVVRQLEPNIVIPMHYQTPALKRELEPVTTFLKEIGAHDITPQPKLSIVKTSLPQGPQIVLLDY